MIRFFKKKLSAFIRYNAWHALNEISANPTGIMQDFKSMQNELLVRSTPILAQKFNITPQHIPQFSALPIYNPSVITQGDGLLFSARESNHTRLADCSMHFLTSPPLHSEVLLIDQPNGSPRRITRLDDSPLRATPGLADYGIEDLRLFRWRGGTYGIAAGTSLKPGGGWSVQQVLLHIEAGAIRAHWPLPSPIGAAVEKNWAPLVVGDDLFLIYTLQPLVIYRFAQGALHIVSAHPPVSNNTDLHGGTPFIPYNDGYLAIAHLAPLLARGQLFYRHVAVIADAEGRPSQVSEPFFLARKGIEFACGLAETPDGFLLSYGSNDSTAHHLTLPRDSIPLLLAGL
jgi:predicted GH43/DUF377 family glycosyl hydrolase